MRCSASSRVVAGIALFLVLGGPAPGSVGSCGEEDMGVSAEEWCRTKNAWICERRWARNELTDEQKAQCRAEIPALCSGATWPADCMPPTRRATEACEGALSDRDRLDEDPSSMPECQFCR